MREAIRDSTDRYQLYWRKRKGFARLATKAQSPIVLAACPRADDIYQIRKSRFTRSMYKYLKLPAPVATGIGPTMFPKPVPLTHVLSDPIMPPPHDCDDETIHRFHHILRQKMERLMERALSIP